MLLPNPFADVGRAIGERDASRFALRRDSLVLPLANSTLRYDHPLRIPASFAT